MKHILLTLGLSFFLFHAEAQSLWGTCMFGGALNHGAILKSNSNGTDFHVVYSFDYLNGSAPIGNLCEGGNGKLYGVTELGGYGDSCVCFEYDTTTGICFNFHNLYLNIDSGWDAQSGMMRAADGMLYGLTAEGGQNDAGVLYRVDPSIDSYSPLYNFNSNTGYAPTGGLIQLSDGKLYGMASTGGQFNRGAIFSFDPISSVYSDLYDFDALTGAYPSYGNLLYANDGKLYGMASVDGANGYGVLFSYDLNNDVYSDLHDFNISDGANPMGSLTQADNGMLYGMTSGGGLSGFGVIFSYDINAQNYSVIYNFDGLNGAIPKRSLTQASNGKFYGTTYGGGLNYSGVAFSFDILNNTYTKLIDFDSIGCAQPSCDILETGVTPHTSIPSLQPSSLQLTLYPSPATNQITITGEPLNNDSRMEITDLTGKVIFDFVRKGNTIDISKLPKGIYLLKINTGDKTAEGKFVKQ